MDNEGQTKTSSNVFVSRVEVTNGQGPFSCRTLKKRSSPSLTTSVGERKNKKSRGMVRNTLKKNTKGHLLMDLISLAVPKLPSDVKDRHSHRSWNLRQNSHHGNARRDWPHTTDDLDFMRDGQEDEHGRDQRAPTCRVDSWPRCVFSTTMTMRSGLMRAISLQLAISGTNRWITVATG